MYLSCPNCGSDSDVLFDKSRGEFICLNCGLVLMERVVDLGREYRAYDREQYLERARDSPLMTSHPIEPPFKDYSGKELDRFKFFRLREIDRRVKSSVFERSLRRAIRLINGITLPLYIKEEAILIFKKACKHKLIRGRRIRDVVAACIYIACREYRVIKPLKEITTCVQGDYKSAAKAFRLIVHTLNLKLPQFSIRDLIIEYAYKLKLEKDVVVKAIDIAQRVNVKSARNPRSIAIACIYIASILNEGRVLQRDLAQVSGLCEVTLRNTYKEILQTLKLSR